MWIASELTFTSQWMHVRCKCGFRLQIHHRKQKYRCVSNDARRLCQPGLECGPLVAVFFICFYDKFSLSKCFFTTSTATWLVLTGEVDINGSNCVNVNSSFSVRMTVACQKCICKHFWFFILNFDSRVSMTSYLSAQLAQHYRVLNDICD